MRTNKTRYPLRRVIEMETSNEGRFETLECGHRIRTPEDIIGYTNAYRRRCRDCWQKSDELKGSKP